MSRNKDEKTYCLSCPCVTGSNTPSSSALNALSDKNEREFSKKTQGGDTPVDSTLQTCEWYINSAEHDYCFWRYAQTITESVSDKMICQLLCISQTELKDAFSSAIQKLQGLLGTDEMEVFLQSLVDKTKIYERERFGQNVLDTDEMTASVIRQINEKERQEQERRVFNEESSKIIKIRKKRESSTTNVSSQPRSRDGKKINLYGLSGSKKHSHESKTTQSKTVNSKATSTQVKNDNKKNTNKTQTNKTSV